MLPDNFRCILGLLLVLLGGCCGPDLVSNDEIRGQDIRPYVGLMRNFSARDISIPSQNSDATLILPAQGQLEYIVWKPNVDIFGYADGRQVYFQNIRINPRKKYTFFGKSYYFLAEVCPDLQAPAILPRECPGAMEPKLQSGTGSPRKVGPS